MSIIISQFLENHYFGMRQGMVTGVFPHSPTPASFTNTPVPISLWERIKLIFQRILFFVKCFFSSSFREEQQKKALSLIERQEKELRATRVKNRWQKLTSLILHDIYLTRIQNTQKSWLALSQKVQEFKQKPNIFMSFAYRLFPEEKEIDAQEIARYEKAVKQKVYKLNHLQKRYKELVEQITPSPLGLIRKEIGPGIADAFAILLNRLEVIAPKVLRHIQVINKEQIEIQLEKPIKLRVTTQKKIVQGGFVHQILGDTNNQIKLRLKPATKTIYFESGFITECTVSIPLVYTGFIRTTILAMQHTSPTSLVLHTHTNIAIPLIGNTQQIRLEESVLEEFKRDWEKATLD